MKTNNKLVKELLSSPIYSLAETLLNNRVKLKELFVNELKSTNKVWDDLKEFLKKPRYLTTEDKKLKVLDPALVIHVAWKIIDSSYQQRELLTNYLKGVSDVK